MDTLIMGVVLAVLVAVSAYEFATGYAGIRLGFTRQRVYRADQPLLFWAVLGIKLSVAAFIAWRICVSG